MTLFDRVQSENKNKKILMTGASGLVGRNLGRELTLLGYDLFVVSRSKSIELNFPHHLITGDLSTGPIEQLKNIDFYAVIHLMGESVAQRWNDEIKASIKRSRIEATQNLKLSLSGPKIFISGSAIGFYGDQQDQILNEESLAFSKEDFLARVCQEWESEALAFKKNFPDCRIVISRTGMVLDSNDGALGKMLPFFKLGLGGKIGNGQSWMSWIHIEDLVQLLVFALENNQVEGVVNAVNPNPTKNEEFTRTLAETLKRPAVFPVPQFGLKTLYGEMSQIVLASQRVIPKKLLGAGFQFKFSNLAEALSDLIGPIKLGETRLVFDQYVPGEIQQIFEFFSTDKNLEKITPDSLSFQVLNKSTPEIKEGTLITYRLKIHGIPASWVTLIEKWNPPFQFVDTQIKGPYSKWHHTHQFFKTQAGVIMRDTVIYKEPLGALGRLTSGPLVKSDVQKIFLTEKKF